MKLRIRKTIYTLFYNLDLIFKKTSGLFVLCYHSIDNSSWKYSSKPSDFKKQMKYLVKNFKFINPSQLKDILSKEDELPLSSFLLTFDDGYQDIFKLRKYINGFGVRPLIFLLADSKNRNRKVLETDKPLLTTEQIKTLIKDGWYIGCHSMTHTDLSNLNKEELKREVIQSKRALEKKLGIKVKYFSYPKGFLSDKLIKIVKKAGYEMAFSMNSGYVSKKTNAFKIPREGVDGSHSFPEFKSLFSPSVVFIKAIFKKIGLRT